MAFTPADIEAFIAALHDDRELRDRVRDAILADDFLALPGIVRGLGERIDQLTERMDQLVGAVKTLAGKVGNLEGWRYEARYETHVATHLVPAYWNARLVVLGNLPPLLDALRSGVVTRAEWDDLVQLDLLALARKGPDPADAEVFVAAELSIILDEHDVRRVHSRAEILRKAGLEVDAVVDGSAITETARRLATSLGVSVLHPRELAA